MTIARNTLLSENNSVGVVFLDSEEGHDEAVPKHDFGLHDAADAHD